MARPPPPIDGAVRIVKDDCSALFALVCAIPCRGDRCINDGGHPGQRPLPDGLRGICWLGSDFTREACARIAARAGWRVLEDTEGKGKDEAG